MHDEQMAEEKKKIIRLLLSHMNCRFYPLACESFVFPGMTVDRAVAAMLQKEGLPSAGDRKVRNSMFPFGFLPGANRLTPVSVQSDQLLCLPEPFTPL